MVGAHQVVIDGLRHADDTHLVTLLLGELGNLVGRILRVVAARVKEVADVVGFEHLKHALEILALLELVTTGAERRARRVTETADGLLRLRSEVDELFVEDP